MLGMAIEPWILYSLLAFSVAVTLIANWMAAGFQRPVLRRSLSLGDILTAAASLMWILLVFAAGVIATRYIERIANKAIGYLVFGVVVLALSLVRAQFFLRISRLKRPRVEPARKPLTRHLVHNSLYLLFATTLYLALSWLLRRPAELLLFIPLWVGALLPDLDSQSSVVGRLLPPISRWLEGRFGRCQEWHSLCINVLVGLLASPLAWLVSLQVWYMIPLGFLSHLLLDVLTPQGIMLFWPMTRTRHTVLGGPIQSTGNAAERWLAAVLAVVTFLLLLAVDFGPQSRGPVPVPSYAETLERYHATRGSVLMFAYVDGTWQATGRRFSGRFEILSAIEGSYIMLDRYTGEVFTAGRSAHDNVHVNSIRLQTGPSATIKPAAVHLRAQRLVDGLPILYQMQQEPGLQHIYVSGDVVLPVLPEVRSPTLEVDYSQTSLRQIQAHEPGHFSLHFLAASDLINLANLEVITADLVIVATYASPATGPTATPLPSPPAAQEPVP